MLELRSITKDYVTASETVHALKGVDITFRDKEFVSILGPSGCGKTTLLNIIGGLDHYTNGDLIINGRSTKSYKDRDWDVYRNHRIGFIFQSYNLIPHQTVLGNVELALTIAGMSREERIEKAKRALDKVGLADQYYKRPNQLSGGQCQRVAIARALVNDPEILLADEPTGALDTVTSVQIMDLIREIAGERLVIMVTHNPELAEEYSTRIIRLLDGNVIEDTNPVSSAEIDEANAILAEEKAREEAEAAAAIAEGKKPPKKQEKAKMSPFTAFRLSAKNLLSKKGRTTMVGIAGSIGIIGIAMVLAFSAGIKGYVASMQDDMLSGNPIRITETTYDMNALTGMMTKSQQKEIIQIAGKVPVNSLVEYMATMSGAAEELLIKNNLTAGYMKYVADMPSEYYAAMTFGYGIDMNNNIFTEFKNWNGDSQRISISALTNIYTSVMKQTEFADYSSYITQVVPSFAQAPNSTEYIAHQYDVIGEIADEYNEIMLVLDSNDTLSDVLLARLGYYDYDEFMGLIYSVSDAGEFEAAEFPTHFSHEELLGKTFVWYPNDSIYSATEGSGTTSQKLFDYYSGTILTENGVATTQSPSADGAVELKVTGILYTNPTTTYGCLTSGIYYTEALTNYVLEANADSEIVEYVKENGDIQSLEYKYGTASISMGVYYDYDFYYNGEVMTDRAFVGGSAGLDSILGSLMGGGSSGAESRAASTGSSLDLSSLGNLKTLSLRQLGGNSVANSVSIYPVSFDSKDLVTEYLDKWNGDTVIIVDGEPLIPDARDQITYTDNLDLVIDLINGMIDVVTTALIAFTSVSLIVSTVMIGIITYVSVVERIKEIGVIRSLGGRKKDVSRLFTAETVIIGFLAGLIGVGFTALASVIVSAIIYAISGIPNIATLLIGDAVTMLILSTALTLVSGLIPASSAAKKDPVVALRTE